MTAHGRVLAFVSSLFLASQSAVAPRFAPIQTDLLSTGGTLVNAAADFDNDGDVDLFVGFNGAANRLYRNDRGVLVETAALLGVADARPTRAAAWGDFDADGDSDLLIGFAPVAAAEPTAPGASVLRLYRNDRTRFTDVTQGFVIALAAGAVGQPAWVDVDADGDLDLFVGFRDRADVLFRNTAGTFADVAPELGLADTRKTVGAVWFDYDEDGDLDLYAAHMDGDANALYRNDGGRFTDVADAAGLAWGGRTPREAKHGTVRPCVADVNGDGRLDLFTANYGPNGLFLNRGGGRFEDVSAAWGIALDARYDTCAFGDFDNDGLIDLYVNGTVTGGTSYRDHLFRNTGTRFEDVTPDDVRALHADHGALWADIDGDGDVDLALTGGQASGMHHILRNLLSTADAQRSIRVRVVDAAGRATRAGAEVRVYVAGTRRLIAAQLVDSGSGYDGQNDLPLHFGLGTADRVDIEAVFPAASLRAVTAVRNVAAGEARIVTLSQPRAIHGARISLVPKPQAVLNVTVENRRASPLVEWQVAIFLQGTDQSNMTQSGYAPIQPGERLTTALQLTNPGDVATGRLIFVAFADGFHEGTARAVQEWRSVREARAKDLSYWLRVLGLMPRVSESELRRYLTEHSVQRAGELPRDPSGVAAKLHGVLQRYPVGPDVWEGLERLRIETEATLARATRVPTDGPPGGAVDAVSSAVIAAQERVKTTSLVAAIENLSGKAIEAVGFEDYDPRTDRPRGGQTADFCGSDREIQPAETREMFFSAGATPDAMPLVRLTFVLFDDLTFEGSTSARDQVLRQREIQADEYAHGIAVVKQIATLLPGEVEAFLVAKRAERAKQLASEGRRNETHMIEQLLREAKGSPERFVAGAKTRAEHLERQRQRLLRHTRLVQK